MISDSASTEPNHARRMQLFLASMTPDETSVYFVSQAAIANRVAREVFRRRTLGDFDSGDLLLRCVNHGVRHMAEFALTRYFPEIKRPEQPPVDDDYVPPSPRSEDGEPMRVVPETPIRDLDQFHEIKQHDFPYGPPSPEFGPTEATRDVVLLNLDEVPRDPAPVTPAPRAHPSRPITRSQIKRRVSRRAAGPRVSRPARRRL